MKSTVPTGFRSAERSGSLKVVLKVPISCARRGCAPAILVASNCVVIGYKRSGTLRGLRAGRATARTCGVAICLFRQLLLA